MADLEQVTISLPRPLVERLRAEARRTNDSVSHTVRKLLLMADTVRAIDGAKAIDDIVVSV